MRAAAAALAALLALPAPAVASEEDRETAIASLPGSAYAESIHQLDPNVHQLDANVHQLDANISPMESTTTQGEETVITLASDILFAFDEATVEGAAADKITELLAAVPDGATVEIGGHTDAISDDTYNQELSEKRAQAVADLLAQARPDLELEVAGYGESRPVADNEKNGEDDPEGRALNRRVEIRYEG